MRASSGGMAYYPPLDGCGRTLAGVTGSTCSQVWRFVHSAATNTAVTCRTSVGRRGRPQRRDGAHPLLMPWTEDDSQPIFEYACHEGNYGLRNILSAGRSDDKKGIKSSDAVDEQDDLKDFEQ